MAASAFLGTVMLRILVAGLLGCIAMYVWSAVAHGATDLGTIGVSTLPSESVTVDNLASAIGDKGGLFLFPTNMNANASVATGPGGFLVYNPRTPMSAGPQPKSLVIEFFTELVETVLAAWLLAQTALAGFVRRAGFVTVIGVIGTVVTNVPYWNWYAFPLTYTLGQMFVQIVGFILAGAAIAAYLRPTSSATPKA
jgi:hypothetical protein